MNNDQNNNFGNLIDAVALIIGLQNLFENRAQTAQNDVQAANDKQAEYLLSEINRRFDEQNKMLEKLLQTSDARIPREGAIYGYVCPMCANPVRFSSDWEDNFCPTCGVQLDWSKYREE